MKFIPVSVPDLGDLERRFLLDAYDSTWISSTGKYLDRFERDFAAFCGASGALGVANGTVAIHLALAALDIGPGDEVIVPSLTYIATANAVRYCGAEPVFADVEMERWGLNVVSVEAAITPQTKAIIAVHLYGQPADMVSLRMLADQYGLALVEDAAEAPGAAVDGVRVGALGDVATFSFYGNKVLTSGEGGAVTTNDPLLADRMRLLRGQGMDPSRRYWFPVMGYNYRMTNLAAAILCAQLERFEELRGERERIYSRYDAHFSSVDGLELQARVPGVDRSPWLYCVLMSGAVEDFRDQIASDLLGAGVDTRPFFIPLHSMPPYRDAARQLLPATDNLSRRGLNLPTYPSLTNGEVDHVASWVVELVSDYARKARDSA